MKTIYELKDELCYLFTQAQLAPWMLGINSGDFYDLLPDDNDDKKKNREGLTDLVYNHPEEWMSDFKFIIDGGVEGDEERRGSGRDRKKIGAAILTSGMIHVCQSQIYDPESLGRHVGFAKFMNSVKSWSDAAETITLLSNCRFLFVSEVYIAADTNKTMLRTVAESFNDLLERRENHNLVTIVSVKPSMIKRAMAESDFLGAGMKAVLDQLGDVGTIIMKDKRLCRIAF